jgi:hypothetical protein
VSHVGYRSTCFTVEGEETMSTPIVRNAASVSLAAATFMTLLSGCSVLGPGTGTAPEPQPAVVGPGAPVTTDSDCPNPRGGSCLGPLPAGEYRTTTFEPQIGYTVPQGWTNLEDRPGDFRLSQPRDTRSGPFQPFRQYGDQESAYGGSFFGIYRNAHAAALDCDELWQGHVGTTPDELVAWYETVPGLIVSEPLAVTVGGLDGLQIDLSLESGAGTCSFDGHTAIPLTIGNGISRLHHAIVQGLDVRLVFLAWGDGNVTLEITNVREQHSAEDFRSQLQPIIDSLVFDE